MKTDNCPAWSAVRRAASALAGQRIEGFFATDPQRIQDFRIAAAGLIFDYSRARMDRAARQSLLDFALARDLTAQRDAMFAGEPVNTTEGRAANHMALRAEPPDPEVREEAKRAAAFADGLRSDGTTDLLWLGIGGSDLGPRMVVDCLAEAADGPTVHFVSNVDGAALGRVLPGLVPATTRVIVASKSFGTQETMLNARSARAWMAASLGEAETGARFAAVTSAPEAAASFGIDPARIFTTWDWVGGRFSLWSSVGIAIRVALGNPAFDALLAGAAEMDRHFRQAPLEANMPVIAALLDIWNVNALDLPSLAICPYSARMGLLVDFLQQLIMESNGKRVDHQGRILPLQGAPVIWGGPGTDSQHSVFQWLHQSPASAPVEFVLPVGAAPGASGDASHQQALIANCLAQASALMLGRDAEATRAAMSAEDADALVPHRVFPGNIPSNLILMDALEPARLGALIAFYEHRVAAQAAILGFNAFDQWGVEFGKTLANRILPLLSDDDGTVPSSAPDPATAASLAEIVKLRNS
ncbi:MAG: glucose-6-phosphate isomerase [Pseudomonadota bacterium]